MPVPASSTHLPHHCLRRVHSFCWNSSKGGGMHKCLTLVNTTIYFRISSPRPTRSSPKQSNRAPPVLPAGRMSCPIPPPSRPCAFSWLLCVYDGSAAVLGHNVFYYWFFWHSICHPEWRDSTPSHILPWSCLLSDIPQTPNTGYWLAVVSSIRWHPSKPNAPLLSLFSFFGCSIWPPCVAAKKAMQTTSELDH